MTDIPYGNLTALNHEIVNGWELSATKRGTSDILYSCIVTITLCIYTAIHLNIPEPQESTRQKYLRLAKWVVIGIFAPEWVIYAAWRQWKDARDFLRHINEHADSDKITAPDEYGLSSVHIASEGEASQSSTHERGLRSNKNNVRVESARYNTCPQTDDCSKGGHVADMAYAFYAMMGGFRVDVSDISDQVQSIVLTNEGLLDLVSAGGYRHIQLGSKLIDDRSKANNLAKLLVCSQVTWMATQCIARKASGLPLTLLELHTFAHVLCALFIYIFWFKKPLSVNEATTITLPDRFRGKIAYAVTLHHEQAVTLDVKDQLHALGETIRIHLPEHFILQTGPHIRSFDQRCKDAISAEFQSCGSACTVKSHWSHNTFTQGSVVTYDPNDIEDVFIHGLWVGSYEDYVRVKVSLTEKDKLRWRLVRTAKPDKDWPTSWELLQIYSSTRRTTYPMDGIEEDEKGIFKWLSIIFGETMINFTLSGVMVVLAGLSVPCAYGGIHLSAWGWTFPSRGEMWMWRACALYLTASIPCLQLCIYVYLIYNPGSPRRPAAGEKPLIKLATMVRVCLSLILHRCMSLFPYMLLGTYPIARIFLVVEVFLSLRTVPVGVYVTLPWTQYIPHL